MILSAAGSDFATREWERPGIVPWGLAVLGAELLAWAQSALAGLLVTAVVVAVMAAAAALRRACRRLEAIVAEELDIDPTVGVGPGR